jgi:hypothetical protein
MAVITAKLQFKKNLSKCNLGVKTGVFLANFK